MRKVIYCSDSEVLIDWDGTVYHGEADEDLEPVMICNDSYSNDSPLTRETVENFSWEVSQGYNGSPCSCVIIPSYGFSFELKTNLGFNDDMVCALEDYFSEELESADKEAEDYLKPLEIEKIREDFNEWLDEEQKEADFRLRYYGQEDTRTEYDKIHGYMNEMYDLRREYMLTYTDEDELEKILREELGNGTTAV